MLIEATITPTPETEKLLFARPAALINFKAGARRGLEMLEKEVRSLAPKATGDYLASISSTLHEYGDPYRIVCRCYSVSNYADIIEFGAEPHVVPTRQIMRWMQAVHMDLKHKKTPEEVAFLIQQKIAERGLKPKYVFTQAYDVAEQFFRNMIDPVLDAIGGEAEYTFELKSSGNHF